MTNDEGMSAAGPALRGIRVLELGGQLSGPYAAMVLADLGAEVIKIESPNLPDPARLVPSTKVGDQTTYFLSLNRNKRSVTLDLKDPADHEAFLRLVDGADVVLDNFRPGVTERLRIDHDRLAARNPRIITCSLSGFGHTGPDRERPGYDYLMQALAGTMALTGDPSGPPAKYGISVVDHVGGLFAAIGVLAAVVARDRDPQAAGCSVDIALLDTHLSLLSYVAGDLLNGGSAPQRQRLSAHPTLVPAQAFPTADSYVVVMPLANHFFPLLCEAVDLPELASDPRFVDAARRLEHRDELLPLLERRFAEETTQSWVERLAALQVPVAPVQSVEQALAMPQVEARDMIVRLEHPAYGAYRAVGNPIKISGSGQQPLTPAPTTGQDNAEVLGGFGHVSDPLRAPATAERAAQE